MDLSVTPGDASVIDSFRKYTEGSISTANTVSAEVEASAFIYRRRLPYQSFAEPLFA